MFACLIFAFEEMVPIYVDIASTAAHGDMAMGPNGETEFLLKSNLEMVIGKANAWVLACLAHKSV